MGRGNSSAVNQAEDSRREIQIQTECRPQDSSIHPRQVPECLPILSASVKLNVIDLDVAANMIGRHNAQRAARQVFGAMQIRLLNLHIILTVLDEVSEVSELLSEFC